MLDKQLILGVYDDGDKLVSAVKKLRKRGVEIFDCYTPYPVHNLDVEMGVKRSNLTVGAFLCGLIGFCCGLLLQFYTMTNHLHAFKSWPMNIGGKWMLFIPPELGYGSRGAGNVIPPHAPLIFEVELLDIRK